MATLNLLLNSLQGEIALMDALSMDYQKSWEVSCRNVDGCNLPVYRVIENKDDSVLWKMHVSTFKFNKEKREKESAKEASNQPPQTPDPVNKVQKNPQLTLF